MAQKINTNFLPKSTSSLTPYKQIFSCNLLNNQPNKHLQGKIQLPMLDNRTKGWPVQKVLSFYIVGFSYTRNIFSLFPSSCGSLATAVSQTQRPHSLKLAALNTNTMKNTSEKKTEKLVNPNVILGNLFPLLLSCMNVDAFLSFLTLEQS